MVKIWNNTLESHSSILIFIEDEQDRCRFNTNKTNRVNQYVKYYQPSCVRTQSRSDSKILDATYLSDAKDFSGALLVREGGIQCIYLWISEKESFCIAPLQVDSENREVYTRVIIQKDLIAICSEFVESSVAVQIWRRQTSNFVKVKTVWTKCSKMGRVVKLVSLNLNKFCLTTDNELRFFDKDNSKVNAISIDHSYVVKDIIYNIGDHRLVALYSNDESVCYVTITVSGTESDFKLGSMSRRQVILDPLGQRWAFLNQDSVLEVFEGDELLSTSKLRDGGLLCNLSKYREVIMAAAQDDGNILGYLPRNGEHTKEELCPKWQVGCDQSDDDTSWKVLNFYETIFVKREYTFSFIEKDQEERQILFEYNKVCALCIS